MNQRLRCACSPQAEMAAAELSPGLAAQQCGACGACALQLDDYRQWRERQPAAAAMTEPAARAEEELDARARMCPGCARLMQRYRVGTQPDFRLDACSACQLVWLDRGEWASLAQGDLSGRLTEILSEAWQRRLRADELRGRREAGLRAKHGDACIDELIRIRGWLDAQPQREELLALLRAGW